MAMNRTNASHWLRRVYPQKTRDAYSTKHGKLWATMPRSTAGFGESFDLGIEHGGLAGAGGDFTKARARSRAYGASGLKFAFTETTFYSFAHIAGNLMRKAKASDQGMVKQRLIKAAERANRAFNHRWSRYIYGDGFGSLGTVSASTTLASTRIILGNREDHINFEENDTVLLAPDVSTSAARNSGATVIVSKVDRVNGYLDITTTLTTSIAAADHGDHIFVDGDRGVGSSPARVLPVGVGGIIPFTVGGSDSFFGVNRSKDRVRYAGWAMGASGKTERQATLEALFQMQTDNAETAVFYMNPTRGKNLAMDIESNKMWEAASIASAVANIGVKGFKWQTNDGEVLLAFDPYCPVNEIRGMDLSQWEMRSEGPCPDFINFDDGNIITMHDGDEGELRIGGDLQPVCHEPKANVVIDFDQAA